MACLNKANKIENRAEKIQKYQQLSYKLPGSVIKQLEVNIRDLFNEKERAKIVSKMQKNVSMGIFWIWLPKLVSYYSSPEGNTVVYSALTWTQPKPRGRALANNTSFGLRNFIFIGQTNIVSYLWKTTTNNYN